MLTRRDSEVSVDLSTVQHSKSGAVQTDGRIDRDESTTQSSLTIVNSEQNSVDTAPFLASDEYLSREKKGQTPRVSSIASSIKDCNWLPITLRLPFLSLLFIISLILGIVVLWLTIYSIQHHGLGSGNDSNSSALLFGWRFSPTLIATVYGPLVASMLNDVRRTEVFARLSRLGGASASTTLCFPARSRWNDPFDALNKKINNGVYSWALFFASITNILVLLVMAPLSAGFLSPASIQIQTPTQYNRAQLGDFTWQVDSWDLTTFRTISGAILNRTTSAWLSDFAVLPFWPTYSQSPPFGSSFDASIPQKWTAQTDVYKAELDCIPMELTEMHNTTIRTFDYDYPLKAGGFYNYTSNVTVLELDSHDNCLINITTGQFGLNAWVGKGGGWWNSKPDYSGLLDSSDFSNSTTGCNNRTLVFAKSPGFTRESTQIQAHLCSRKFYSASVLTNVTVNQSSTSVVFDSEEYYRNRKTLDLTELKHNLSTFEEAFLSPDWSAKFPHHEEQLDNELGDDTPWFGGPLLAISAVCSNNATTVATTRDLADDASKLYQQFFGEMLLLALQSGLSTKTVQGYIDIVEQRILVSSGIGITLTVLFFLSACFVALVAYHTKLSRRPLNLHQDPGGIAAAASLMTDQAKQDFQGTDHVSKAGLEAKLGKHTFSMEQGRLLLIHGNLNQTQTSSSQNQQRERKRDPRPALLRGWMGPLLLFALSILIAALVILYHLSHINAGIHQSAFVYQMNVDVLGAATTLAPYSIIPTLCAIGIKLWFSSIGDIFKRLQPYISMAKSPTKLPNSVMTEYVNTPTPFMSIKAMQHSHWILVLIGIGAFATEAFTVGMSALWELEIRSANRTLSVPRHLTLRNTPQLIPWSKDGRMAGPYFSQPQDIFLPNVYTKSVQTWLYGAVVEMSQSAPTPPWTMDTWSFVPLDVDDLSSAIASLNGLNAGFPGRTRNISFQTTALRASLQCEPLDYTSNKSIRLEKLDFSTRGWNSTNRPPGLSHGYTLKGPANAFGNFNFSCCANETEGVPGDAAVGYWTNYDQNSKLYQKHMSANWIYGQPLNGTFQPSTLDYPMWIWPEEPKIFATNCTPLIEQADAYVVAEIETGVVQKYEILTNPNNATLAWSDDFLEHNSSADFVGETYHYTISEENVTVSWGNFFWDTLLNSGRSFDLLAGAGNLGPQHPERYRSFNFQIRGLNVDFMSFAMLALANNSKEALLDPTTFMELANTTFGVFFKHYAAENVTSLDGGNTFEPIGEKLPWALGPVLNETNTTLVSSYQGAMATENDTSPVSRVITATYSIPVEQLVMSPVAVYLCLSLLGLLALTTIIIYSVNRSHFKALPRDVDTLASTLAFVHNSERLLDWAQDGTATKPWYKLRSREYEKVRQQSKQMTAQMGPFVGADGKQGWGIELVEAHDIGNNHDDDREAAHERTRLHEEEH